MRRSNGERGSALVLSLFVMLLLSALGAALLFVSQVEVKMSHANLRTSKAFFLAEAGLENGRQALHNAFRSQDFSDALEWHAGVDTDLQFDMANVQPVFDSGGNVTSFTGYGDDLPLSTLATLDDGWQISFLTNDPFESELNEADGNDRVMITAYGVGRDGSIEVVQAIVEREEIFPSIPPATITLLGPLPVFEGSHSDPKIYTGDDCGGSIHVPVVGTIGPVAEANAELGIYPNPLYTSDGMTGDQVFADLLDTSEPTVSTPIASLWTDCQALHDMVEEVRLVADVICTGSSCTLPPNAPDRIVFVDGDFDVNANQDGEGLLVVTGKLNFSGNAKWDGLVYVIGEGLFERDGGGNDTISGATVVADIAGPDDMYGTADDCTGGDGGFSSVLYEDNGGGNSGTAFCQADAINANPIRPYQVVSFRQY